MAKAKPNIVIVVKESEDVILPKSIEDQIKKEVMLHPGTILVMLDKNYDDLRPGVLGATFTTVYENG